MLSKIIDNMLKCWGSTVAGGGAWYFAWRDLTTTNALNEWSIFLVVLGFASIGGRVPEWLVAKFLPGQK